MLYIRVADAGSLPAARHETPSHATRGWPVTTGRGVAVVGATWGPAGEVAVLTREPDGPRLAVLRPDGTGSEIDPGVPDVAHVHWGQQGWMAMSVGQRDQPPDATLFLDPATGDRSVLDGWLPLAWSPDGCQLLVADAAGAMACGVVDVADLTTVRSMGAHDIGSVWDAAWLPA